MRTNGLRPLPRNHPHGIRCPEQHSKAYGLWSFETILIRGIQDKSVSVGSENRLIHCEIEGEERSANDQHTTPE